MDDTMLRQRVLDALEFEPSLEAAHVGVAAEDGVVTLTGHLTTYAQKVTAEEVALNVKGVRAIAQEIEVRPIGSGTASDEEIAKRAVHMLDWNTSVPKAGVQAKVANGWVTLSGQVDWHFQKEAAAATVRPLYGVKGVTNMIEIKPQAVPSDVRKRIQEALTRSANLEAKGLSVTVQEGLVTLKGRVGTWSERAAAERAAWSAPGVRSVDDLIVVGD
jgi:osmotically-inducible protein OsmY